MKIPDAGHTDLPAANSLHFGDNNHFPANNYGLRAIKLHSFVFHNNVIAGPAEEFSRIRYTNYALNPAISPRSIPAISFLTLPEHFRRSSSEITKGG